MPYRNLLILIVSTCVFLGGCATFVENEVVAFHDWKQDEHNKVYTFERTPAQENNLEHKQYENLIHAELARLGFVAATPPQSAILKVTFDYKMNARDVRVVEPVSDPYWPGYWPYWRSYYSPFYDPFWHGASGYYREVQYELFKHTLNIQITKISDGKKLYNVTVDNEANKGSLAFAMPYMIKGAFYDFPAHNGVLRRIKLKITSN